MGTDRIRYFLFINGRWRWRPTKAMRRAGFRLVNLGTGSMIDDRPVPSPEDVAAAIRLNEDWDRHRRGLPAQDVARLAYPKGSIGEAYLRIMTLRETERRNLGIAWTKEQQSRDDWSRAWKWIEPLFGDCAPRSVTPEDLNGSSDGSKIGLRPLVATKVSESEAHRVIKVWRALWKKMARLDNGRYCELDCDPSLIFANPAPQPRQQVWSEGEAVRIVKAAWRTGYRGLAACLATAWDSQLSPVDARRLHASQLRRDPLGAWFAVSRAKTGRAALATLSRRSDRLLQAYLAGFGAQPAGTAPIFRNRSGRPYSKDTLGDDFRAVRTIVFGQAETRQMADFRRSGSVEALEGEAPPEKLSSKMANTLSASNRLHKTYGPVMLAAVRDADAVRRRGRTKLRGQGEQIGHESVTAPVRKVSQTDGDKD
jgi:hypothetical protein